MVTEVEEFLATQDQKISQALARDLRKISEDIDEDELNRILASGVDPVLVDYMRERYDNGFQELSDALTDGFLTGGGLALLLLKIKVQVDILEIYLIPGFKDYKQKFMEAMKTEGLRQFAELLNFSRQRNIRNEIIANQIKTTVGLTQQQQKAVNRFRILLEDGKLEALRRVLRDPEFDNLVRDTFRNNLPLTDIQINRMVKRYVNNLKRNRIETIARSEGTKLYHIAQNSLLTKLINEGVIIESQLRRFWINRNDAKVRHSHRQIPYMNREGRRFDEAFISPLGLIKFPGDPSASIGNTINCRCILRVKVNGG